MAQANWEATAMLRAIKPAAPDDRAELVAEAVDRPGDVRRAGPPEATQDPGR